MKQLRLLLVLILCVAANANAICATYSGSCGTNVTYVLNDSTGVLTISGKGEMEGFRLRNGSPLTPWSYKLASIRTVIINNGVTSIGNFAFYGCSGLTSVTISEGVTSIGGYAFHGCSSLTSVTIPSSLTSFDVLSWEDDPFRNCFALSLIINLSQVQVDVYRPNDFTSVVSPIDIGEDGDFSYYDDGEHKYVYRYKGTDTDVTVPQEYSIGPGCFYNNEDITSVRLLSRDALIGNFAFSNCNRLVSITSPNGIAPSIGCFSGCTSLKTLKINPSATSIAYSAFENCTSLVSITIPHAVQTIGSRAFAGCSNLFSVTNLSLSPQVLKSGTFGRNGTLHVMAGYKELYANAAIWKDFVIVDDAKYVKMTGIALDQEIYNVNALSVTQAVATCYPADAEYPMVEWRSSDENILLVDADGQFIGLQDGTAVLTATGLVDKTVSASAIVKVGNGGIVDVIYTTKATATADDMDVLADEYNTITLTDGGYSVASTFYLPITAGVNYIRHFSSDKWQALYVPFDIPVTAELLTDFEFAKINDTHQYDDDNNGTPDRTTIEFFTVKSGTLAANTPYLIRAKVAGQKTISIPETTLYPTEECSIDCSTTDLLFTFTGVYRQRTASVLSGCYAMGGGSLVLAEGDDVTLAPYRFYMDVQNRNGSGQAQLSIKLRIIGDGETTDIDYVPAEMPADAKYYDVWGRQYDAPVKGVNIVNGKKVIY